MSVSRRGNVLSSRYRLVFGTAALCMSLLAGGCQTGTDEKPSFFGAKPDPQTTGSLTPQDKTVENTQKWAAYLQKNPKDTKAAINYAAHLKALGKNDQALSVLRKTTISNPENTELLTAYGKQLATMGEFPEADKVLAKATATDTSDWKALSVHGTVLDRLGKHDDARTRYQTALKLSPGNEAVLNNLAMSHAVSGDPKKAEDILIKAVANSKDERSAQLRQNLALVLALQGKFDQARAVLAKVLPEPQVEANMAYIKKLISQPNRWKQIKTAGPASKG